MTSMLKPIVLVLSLVPSLGLLGCGARRPMTVPVSGEVRLHGLAVDGATVTFFPSAGRPAHGITDSSGSFRIRTWTDDDGAAPGDYVVCVAKAALTTEKSDNQGYVWPKNLLPEQYSQVGSSNLRATVTRGAANRFVFDLK